MSIFEKTGKMALGSRLRLLTARITDDAADIYALYGIEFVPKWFPVFFLLAEDGAQTITGIAVEVGHSQPSVTKIIQEMTYAGLVREKPNPADKRKNVAELTPKGKRLAEKLRVQCSDIDLAIDGIIAQAQHNLWEAIAEWEYLLEQKSLLSRVREQKKTRESSGVRIVDYQPKYQEAFKSLNEEWITTYFEMEPADYKALDKPKSYILDKGGKIFVALLNNEPVGVCALVKLQNSPYDYELAKMAVSPRAQGKSIGWLLGQAIVNGARDLGASNLYLESNTMLKPAISLYEKLGFVKVAGLSTPYKRCNIQMELKLGPDSKN